MPVPLLMLHRLLVLEEKLHIWLLGPKLFMVLVQLILKQVPLSVLVFHSHLILRLDRFQSLSEILGSGLGDLYRNLVESRWLLLLRVQVFIHGDDRLMRVQNFKFHPVIEHSGFHVNSHISQIPDDLLNRHVLLEPLGAILKQLQQPRIFRPTSFILIFIFIS